MSDAPAPRGIDWLMVAGLGLTWGATFMVIELALEGITPFWLAAGRITFAAVLTLAIWQYRGGALFATPPALIDRARLVLVSALSAAVPFTLLSWGQQYVTSGFAGVSMAAVALIVLPLAHLLVPGERLNARKALGFVIGFAGVVVLIGPKAFGSSGADLEFWGQLACLGAAASYALTSVQMRLFPKIDTIGLSAVTFTIGAGFVVTAAWIAEGPPPLPDMRTLTILAILGLVPTAAAGLLRVVVVRNAGPTFMSLTSYQVPVWSVILGAVFLGEDLPASIILAMVLILLGLALSQWGALRRLFARRQV